MKKSIIFILSIILVLISNISFAQNNKTGNENAKKNNVVNYSNKTSDSKKQSNTVNVKKTSKERTSTNSSKDGNKIIKIKSLQQAPNHKKATVKKKRSAKDCKSHCGGCAKGKGVRKHQSKKAKK